jgi:hypothetical protein
LLPKEHYHRMHTVLHANYQNYVRVPIPLAGMLSALMKDKKNTSTTLSLIFPMGEQAAVQRIQVSPDQIFRSQCAQFLAEING